MLTVNIASAVFSSMAGKFEVISIDECTVMKRLQCSIFCVISFTLFSG